MSASHATEVSRGTPWIDEFVDLLLTWNRRINLLSPKDIRRLLTRHIEDSLELAEHIPPGADRAADIGSGAGFPGLILARHSGIHFDLIESDQRKAAFLREAIRTTHAPAVVRPERAEDVSLPPYSLVTARAVAPLPKLLELAAPLIAPGGVALFPKGPSVDAELTIAATKWHMRVERFPSVSTQGAVILRISGLQRVAQIPS